MERTDELKERIRQQPLNDRLEESRRRIGDMCSKGRCPKMTIPVQHDDDDFYINTTLADAQATIAALQEKLTAALKVKADYDRWLSGGVYFTTAEYEKHAEDHRQREAALQARVKELEDDRSAWKEIAQDWSAAAKLAEQPEKFYEGYSAAVMNAMQALLTKARADLARVTAELEAANHSAQTFQTLWRESCNQRDDLQAELERVRADNKALDKWRADVTVALQRPEGAFFVDVPQHIKDLVKERDDLRTLVVALPKVEYEIKASNFIAHIWPDHDTEEPLVDLRASVAALLKHRQGMEG